MESISSAPKMTEINVDSLPGIRCVKLTQEILNLDSKIKHIGWE